MQVSPTKTALSAFFQRGSFALPVGACGVGEIEQELAQDERLTVCAVSSGN